MSADDGGIVEIYPGAEQGPPVAKLVTAGRDLASTILLWVYCLFSVAQVVVAVAVALSAGVFLRWNNTCLVGDTNQDHQHMCTWTFIACGLTLPICAGVVTVELLPARLVSQGARNLVPLLLLLLGTISWGVYAAAFKKAMDDEHDILFPGWHQAALKLAWSNCSMFLILCMIKLLSGVLAACIDTTSITLGRLCPDGCMPACDACCCLDVRTAKVPREVMRQGQVVVRFMEWDQEAVVVAPPMYR